MKTNIDIYLTIKDKIELQKIKEIENITFSDQIKKILDHYKTVPIEEIDKIIESELEKPKPKLNATITINKKYLGNEKYYLKILKALKTKYPQLDFKTMLYYIIHNYITSMK